MNGHNSLKSGVLHNTSTHLEHEVGGLRFS